VSFFEKIDIEESLLTAHASSRLLSFDDKQYHASCIALRIDDYNSTVYNSSMFPRVFLSYSCHLN